MLGSLKNKKVLVTCGPTWVAIDNVRVISNLSSGQLGQTIAGDFARAGAKVTLLEGPVENPLNSQAIRTIKFRYFDDLSGALKRELQRHYDVCIHAAAVADYKLKQQHNTKLRSERKELALNLTPTKKIIREVKKIQPQIFLVGFKLEPGLTATKAVSATRRLFSQERCDLAVANSVDSGKYAGYILEPTGRILARASSRKNLSQSLLQTIKKKL